MPLAGGAMSYHCWDDGAVVFNSQTGETHQVGLLAIELLTSLVPDQGLTLEKFHAELAEVFDGFDADESRASIESALFKLEACGLVKRVMI